MFGDNTKILPLLFVVRDIIELKYDLFIVVLYPKQYNQRGIVVVLF